MVAVALLCLCGDAFGLSWDGGAGYGLWSDATNWDGDVLPTKTDDVVFYYASAPGADVVIDNGTDAYCDNLNGLGWNAGQHGSLEIQTGGTLLAADMIFGQLGDATLIMNGGLLNISDYLYVGHDQDGLLQMNDGELTAWVIYLPIGTGTGHMQLEDGLVITKYLQIDYGTGTGTIDITGGRLIVDGDQVTALGAFVTSGQITAYGGTGTVNVDYVLGVGGTELSATAGANSQIIDCSESSIDVSEESPTNDTYTIVLHSAPSASVVVTVDPNQQVAGAELDLGSGAGVPIDLTFTTGDWYTPQTVTVTAVDDGRSDGSHSVRIEHSGSSADSDYDGEFDYADVIVNITDNDVSEMFLAGTPGPRDGEVVSGDVAITWSAGVRVNATNGHGVYFGTSYSAVNSATTSSDEYMGLQTGLSYDPSGTLADGTYYWRIDEVKTGDGGSPWKGDVWTFIVTDSLSHGHAMLLEKGLQTQAWTGAFDIDPNHWEQINLSAICYYDGPRHSRWILDAIPDSQWAIAQFPDGQVTEGPPDGNDILTADQLKYLPRLTTLQIGDEEYYSAEWLEDVTDWISKIHLLYPDVLVHTNQFGLQFTESQLRTYTQTAEPDLLTYDSYYFPSYVSPGGSMKMMYEYFAKPRKVALEGHDGTGNTPIPFGQYFQAYQQDEYILSESEIRVQPFCTWIYGGKWGSLFTWKQHSPDSLLYDYPTQDTTDAFDQYAEAIRQSNNLGPALVRLVSTDIRYIKGQHMVGQTPTDNTQPTGVNLWDSNADPIITGIAASNLGTLNDELKGDVLVGYFDPLGDFFDDSNFGSDMKYIMILNGLTDPDGSAYQTRQQISIDFDFGNCDPDSFKRVSRDTGLVEDVTLTSEGGTTYSLDVTIDGGTADLFFYQKAPTTLILDKSSYTQSEDIVASWTDGPANENDWIGIYNDGGVPGTDNYVAHLYANDTCNGGPGNSPDGSATFDGDGTCMPTWPLPTGDYDAFYFVLNSYVYIDGPISFTVTAAGPTTDYASSDIAVSGTVSSSYTDTQASDDTYESITERESGGNPNNRYSYLEHKWLINVTGGDTVIFNVEAYHTSNSEGDDFVFAYSTTGVDGTYTDMVTVTKTADDDTDQSYALPASTSGAVHIRVKDLDQTAGRKVLDTIYIDEMNIVSTASGPDTDAPTPNPATFSSAPSADSSSAISMTATTGSDATGPVYYYFDETSGENGGTDSGWQTSPDYTDDGLDASTQYTYTVQMRDSASTPNVGTVSSPANATTDAGCSATDMHIEAVVCSEVGCGGPNKNGRATVTIYDDCGNPVANALVDGTFGGDFSETIYDIATDANGQAVLTTSGCVRRPGFTFTVDDVTHGTLPYDSNDDLATGCSG